MIGTWLREHTPEDSVFMSNSPQEVFYGNREFILLPRGRSRDYREVLEFAKEKKVRFILVNSETKSVNLNFVESIDARDLKEYYTYSDDNNGKTTVYEILDH